MKKTIMVLAGVSLLASAVAAGHRTKVEWRSLGNKVGDDGKVSYVQRFTVTGDTDIRGIAFNMFDRKMHAVNPADTLAEVFPGYYYVATPRLNGSDTVNIDIEVKAQLSSIRYAADGVHRINRDNTSSPVDYVRHPLDRPELWASSKRDRMPYGPRLYDLNEARSTDWQPGFYDIAPSYKKVTLMPGTSNIKTKPVFVDINPDNPEYYTLDVRDDSLIIACRPEFRRSALMRFIAAAATSADEDIFSGDGITVPNVHIEDWPDHEWRGLHIDIARNYQSPENMMEVLRLMAVNGLNRLHFHPFDDEAWRVEIPGLPELTDVSARRGWSSDGTERDHLYQIFGGNGDPDTPVGTANGHWTREQFVDFLREANRLGIQVLTEIESPGHARAAIKAMEARAAAGDSSYRLVHDGDTSRYTSAQSYHDCVMNPSLPGTYKFMDKVFDELIAMYREAGAPLPGIHIGGDEVPRGSWDGSDSVRVFMQQQGLTNQKEVHAYFVRQMAKMLARRGVPMFGWEEIAIGHGPEFNAEVAPAVGGVNVWHNNITAAGKALRGGFPVILSNVNRFYMDMVYDYHPEELGLTWGGTVDEFDALGGYPAKMYDVDLDSVPGRILGVQGQTWSETIRSFDDLYYMLVPKMFGLAERAWNADSTWSEPQFNAIIGTRVPRLSHLITRPRPQLSQPSDTPNPTDNSDSSDTTPATHLSENCLTAVPYQSARADGPLAMRLRGPGIKVIDGKVHINAPYRGGIIRYTTDGTTPTVDSPVYTAPFPYTPGTPVQARYYRNSRTSNTTYLDR